MVQDHVEKHQYGQFGSWEIVDENIARKICDNSFFKYRGSDVAQDVRWFFGVDDLPLGGKKKIVLVNDEVEYEARFIRETTSLGRIRIFWSPALAEKFAPFENDGKQHSLEFTRIDMDRYEVVFLEKDENIRAWLLTWNRKSWFWDEYPDDCERVNAGVQDAMSWTCTSLRPKIGDEIFLIKLGEQPRGIIGHGRVTRESYEDEHYVHSYLNYLLERVWIIIWGKKPKKKRLAYERTSKGYIQYICFLEFRNRRKTLIIIG